MGSVSTAEELAMIPQEGGKRFELVRGELRMMSPAGGRHGQIALRLGLLLGNHVRRHRLGKVYAAETGFLLSRAPDTVRAPDVAYVRAERAAQIEDPQGFVPFAPDLACEVISPRDSFADVEEKALAWLSAGTRLVLLAEPQTETLHAYRAADQIVLLQQPAELDAGDVVPGWKVAVREVFEE
jgi:Uma2 family endonuclease